MRKMKFIIASAFAVCTMNANAGTNTWEANFWGGWTMYGVSNSQGQSLTVYCNTGAGDGIENDNKIYFYQKNQQNAEANEVDIVINGKRYEYGESFSNLGALSWREITSALSKAKKFDVYRGKSKLATFTPNAASIKNVASGLRECPSLLEVSL